MPLLLKTQRYDTFQSGLGGNPVIVALDPDTGREALVAVFRGDLSENHDIDPGSRLAVHGFAWGRDTLVATGFFRGRVVVGGLRADPESSVKTTCIDIDPGFGSDAHLEDAHGHCKFGSERVRVYGSTLFVARVPVMRPR